MSHIDKELADQLKDWNPMQEAYNDSSFNKYVSGPGADLEYSMQPSELAKKQSQYQNKPDPYLLFINVPMNLNIEGLKNMCSRHGNVLRANKTSSGLHFVNFATINDMERAFSGLQNNSYGFTVLLGKPKNNSHSNINGPLPNVASFPSNRIDYDRSYNISSVNPRRPYFNKNPLVSKEDYDNSDNLLSVVDPQRHFLIEEDAHDLDRVDYSQKPVIKNGKYNYYTGRAYYLMPEKDNRFVEEKQRNTSGVYNGIEEKFFNPSLPVYEQIKFGPCESCEKDCDTICARCSAYFCSVECQTKEWQNHRYVCGKPPDFVTPPAEKPLKRKAETQTPLSDKNDPTQAAALKSQIPESGANVILTAITKTNVVFVRSSAVRDTLKFFETISIIQKEAKLQRPLHHTPKKGEIVFTKFKDDQFNRAMVLNADDLEHIRVVYLDYGNIDSKQIDALFHAPDIFWNLPRMAVPVTLKDVPDFFMNDQVEKYMYAYLNTDMKIVYNEADIVKNTSEVVDVIKSVELFDAATNESYNKTIASFMVTTGETNKSAVVYQEHLEHLPLPVGENVKLVIMDNSVLQTGFISCTTLEYAQSIQKFQEVIQKSFEAQKDTKPYTPRVNELCIAKYPEDDHWYRAKCIEVVGDGHPSILFIDFGNLTFVRVEDIRKYPQEFTFPMLTHDCEIDDLPKVINKETQKKLEDALETGSEIICDKVELKDGVYLIRLDDVLKKILH